MHRIIRIDYEHIISSLFVQFRSEQLSGHNRHVRKPITNKIFLIFRFSQRVINHWMLIPDAIVSGSSTDSFRRTLDTQKPAREGLIQDVGFLTLKHQSGTEPEL